MNPPPTEPSPSVQERLAQLLDERELVGLCHRYATALDTRDWSMLSTCFTADADYEGMPACQGYPAIERLCREALGPLTQTQHLIGNVVVTLDGDQAGVSCYLQAQHVKAGIDGGENFLIAGRYTDEAVRTDDGWRIGHRRLRTWWTAGNPAVAGG